MGICKAIFQRCDVNLKRIHLLLEVLKRNSNLSEPVVLLKRMTSGVYSPGILAFIRWGVNYSLAIRGLVLTDKLNSSSCKEYEYLYMWSYHSMNGNW